MSRGLKDAVEDVAPGADRHSATLQNSKEGVPLHLVRVAQAQRVPGKLGRPQELARSGLSSMDRPLSELDWLALKQALAARVGEVRRDLYGVHGGMTRAGIRCAFDAERAT